MNRHCMCLQTVLVWAQIGTEVGPEPNLLWEQTDRMSAEGQTTKLSRRNEGLLTAGGQTFELLQLRAILRRSEYKRAISDNAVYGTALVIMHRDSHMGIIADLCSQASATERAVRSRLSCGAHQCLIPLSRFLRSTSQF
jgi:hypothetical protein